MLIYFWFIIFLIFIVCEDLCLYAYVYIDFVFIFLIFLCVFVYSLFLIVTGYCPSFII